ncbi:MAG: hypothetical protein WD940_01945 [Patescibacteria group bacterium]
MPSNPRLVKSGIESIQSTIRDLRRDARAAQLKIEDPNTRQALVSLECAVDLLSVLVHIALEPYRRELEGRINEDV